jgi:hypothetical protein
MHCGDGAYRRPTRPAPCQQAQLGDVGPGRLGRVDAHGRDIGRIFKASGGVPEDRPWQRTITGAVIAPRLPSHGFCATLYEAKAKFAETWRA